MGEMHPNAQLVMKGFQAFAEGDMATLEEILAEDLQWHVGGRNKWSGTKNGRDATLRFFGDISADTEIVNQPHAVLADDEHVVVLVNSTLTRGEEVFNDNTTFIFHVSDGLATEVWGTSLDQYATDAFWGN